MNVNLLVKKRKSNNDDKHDHGQEQRRLSTYVEEKNTRNVIGRPGGLGAWGPGAALIKKVMDCWSRVSPSACWFSGPFVVCSIKQHA